MTHDKFCPIGVPHIPSFMCFCDVLAKVRADEREQAAQRMELTLLYKLLDATAQRGLSAAARGKDNGHE